MNFRSFLKQNLNSYLYPDEQFLEITNFISKIVFKHH
jgi:hypothetical protein